MSTSVKMLFLLSVLLVIPVTETREPPDREPDDRDVFRRPDHRRREPEFERGGGGGGGPPRVVYHNMFDKFFWFECPWGQSIYR